MLSRIARSLARPDVRANPLRAVARRARWKLRWLMTRQPWRIRLPNGLPIDVPWGGAGALIYYQGFSEPLTAEFVIGFLKSGMVFLDVGAHIGEYTLLAASIVGERGRVHAFEPVNEVADLLRRNVQLNEFRNVEVHPNAVAEQSDIREFEIFEERSLSSLVPGVSVGANAPGFVKRARVSSIRLDDFQKQISRQIDLIKVDVEGAELLVLAGATQLLSRPANEAPVWILEYGPENYRKFGYGFSDLLQILSAHAYSCLVYRGDGRLSPVASESMPAGVINLIASKRSIDHLEEWLQRS